MREEVVFMSVPQVTVSPQSRRAFAITAYLEKLPICLDHTVYAADELGQSRIRASHGKKLSSTPLACCRQLRMLVGASVLEGGLDTALTNPKCHHKEISG